MLFSKKTRNNYKEYNKEYKQSEEYKNKQSELIKDKKR